MPNHITNIIKAPEAVLAALATNDKLVDFNCIIEMPKTLQDVTCISSAETLAELLTGRTNIFAQKPGVPGLGINSGTLDFLKASNALEAIRAGGINKLSDEDFETLVQMLRNHRAYGALTWHDWACEKWGTKWNAYDIVKVDGGIKFETAWSAPHPVIVALTERFPDEKIEHSWADEDIGNNLGRRFYQFGKATDFEVADPVDFALSLTGSDREGYRKDPVSGKWEYHDEAEG